MAVSELPTDATVDGFLAIVGHLEHNRAIRILQFHNNDVSQAINDYFDDPDSSKYDRPLQNSQQNQRWDEDAFGSNRDGSTNNTGISFTIEASDEFPPDYGPRFDGAPSRPPSRTSNNKSPHHGKVIDMSAQHAAADPRTSMTAYNSNNDPELAQALAASLLPQESGVTNTEAPAFGPATRSQYEQGKWELVPTTTLREVILDPEPLERKRDLGVPAFLKPSVEDHRVGALLTIYHEIPMLREMFLDRSNIIANYGNDREWWTGKAMEIPTITGTEELEQADFRHELQRLMAFLDKTDRSYGSAEALVNLPLVKQIFRSGPSRDIDSAVLEAFKEISRNSQSKIKKLFSRGVDGPEENNDQEFAILQLPLPLRNSYAETLYDIADSVMWEATSLDLNSSPFLTNIGEVISFRFTDWDQSKKKGITVPAVWYPDRYLDTGRQAALDMRLRRQDIVNDLEKIEMIENGLTNVDLRSGRRIKVKELFSAALQHDRDEPEAQFGVSPDDTEENISSVPRPSKSKKLSAELLKIVESIDRKLIALSDEREKAKDALRELSKLYTQQLEGQDQPTLHKYTLRGVSTSKNTLYICRPAVPELIDIDLESEGSQPKGDQWWKIHFATSEPKPVNVEKTSEDKVLEAAGESNSSMLVYASEKAMTWVPQPLPIPLETFVRKDNVWFKNELPSTDSPVSSPKLPASPGKRKVESSAASDEALQDFRYRGNSKVSDNENGDPDFKRAPIVSGSLAHSGTINGNNELVMIEGVDPDMQEVPGAGQEMQQRNSMRMLAAQSRTEQTKPIDFMDTDQVMEDDNVAQETGAVKHVGFMD